MRRTISKALVLAGGLVLGTAAISPAAVNVSPTSLDFGPLQVGKPTATQLVTVSTGSGDDDREVVGVNVVQGGIAFEVVQNNCQGQTLPPAGGSCSFGVRGNLDRALSSGAVQGRVQVELGDVNPGQPGTLREVILRGTYTAASGKKPKKPKKCKKGKGKKGASAAKKCKKGKK